MRQITEEDYKKVLSATDTLRCLRDDYFEGKPDDYKPEKYKQISHTITDLIAVSMKMEDILNEQKEVK